MNNEPKAFPGLGQDGLTMRDYLAAKVVGLFIRDQMKPYQDYNIRNAASDAYRLADAMMKERENDQAQTKR